MAMEDFRVDVVIGKGPGATAIPLEIPPFTLVGATTRAGLLPGPLRDRFGFTGHLEFYEPHELDRIVHRSAGLLDVELTGRRRRRDRLALPRHARGSPTGCCAGSATTPRCAPTASSRCRSSPRRARALRGRRARPRPARPRPCSTRCAAASAGDRSASPRSRSPWARSARPSRRSPSRSWCATASWPVRRAAGSPRRPPGSTSGSPRRPRRRSSAANRRGRAPLRGLTATGSRSGSHSRLHLPVGRPVRRPTSTPSHAREVFSCQRSSSCCRSSASRCSSGSSSSGRASSARRNSPACSPR